MVAVPRDGLTRRPQSCARERGAAFLLEAGRRAGVTICQRADARESRGGNAIPPCARIRDSRKAGLTF